MVQNTYINPLPAADMTAATPAFAVQVAPTVERMVAFLGSRAKACALPLSDSTVSPLELAPADKQGNRAHTTFTKAQVVAIAREVVAIMADKPSPAAVRDSVPSYWLGPKAPVRDLVKALTLTYTPSKGNNADVELNAAGHCVAAYRRDVKRLNKANKLASTLKAGTGWFAVGVLDNSGNPRPYTSEKKARKAYCRLTHDQGRVTRAAAASLDDLSPSAVRALAKKAGAPKRITTGSGATARSRQWFSDDITRLEGVMTPQ
jgi:hypothetical protein